MSVNIFGKNPCREILNTERAVTQAFVINNTNQDLRDLIIKKQIPLCMLDKLTFDSRFSGNHQGIVLEIEEYRTITFAELEIKIRDSKITNPILIMLDGIEDPHNFGAIIRSAEAGGVFGIIIPKNRSVGITGTVAKVASGAIEHINIIEVTNLNQTIAKLKKLGFWIVGTDIDAQKRYDEIIVDPPLCLIIGNEGKGISRLVKENADYTVKIPMVGKTNSLNASVSAGIIIFEVLRKRAR
ncbi:MAG: 23S rRNA (guanosine(2251)-2'-O)-methyltransferase RlmB [Candidatus Izemoplasmatales bacterium]|jgi:23S rRNA (guanosine2251-2'-O)-methyltransferase|nr:23S rRNA (guanosine(2251)-2'-O)-methyltransferase RlmB [Candidatus Izemoplasmatales bacterium]MDD4595651.1 23S rRNA (guanosine(2251)-2'-O)-methyltransferase RlmB [Candidatus Izemoplasmatales bacterium]